MWETAAWCMRKAVWDQQMSFEWSFMIFGLEPADKTFIGHGRFSGISGSVSSGTESS